MNNRRRKRITYKPSSMSRTGAAINMVVGLAFLVVGFTLIIPVSVAFGVIWCLICAALIITSAYLAFGGTKHISPEVYIEDEEVPAQADARLDWALVWLTTAQLLALLLFAVSVSMMPLGYAGPGAILASAAELLAVLFAVIALQGRVVDLTRRFNPEKQGSVYDFKFRKKWLASCDEAERQRIGQAGFTGFMACNSSCLITAVVLMVLNALLPIGPLPSIAVMIPWIAGQAAYLAECVRTKKGPGRS